MLEFLKSSWQFIKNAVIFLEKSHNLADWIFTIIILFISTTSFFHVVEYWTLTNKFPFYYITAVATELVIIGSMMAIRYTPVAWLPFILGVLVQGIGNIFYSYINIDVNSNYFKQFMELFKPWFELAYGDELEIANYKRVLAYSNGLFYLSPIVFLWAKMALKTKVRKLAAATPAPVSVAPAPVTLEPVSVASEPAPAPVSVAPEPVTPEPVTPEPVSVASEPAPAPVSVTPEPVTLEPVSVASEPVSVTPEPVLVASEPVSVTPEPVLVVSEPEVLIGNSNLIEIPSTDTSTTIIDKLIDTPIVNSDEKKN